MVNQNNVVSEEQLAALLAAAQLQEVPPPPPPPSLVPRSSLMLTVDEQQDGDEMDMEELDDDPYTAAARACSNGNDVDNDEVDDALAHTYTETERELAAHAALHARMIHSRWICTQRRPQSQHGTRQNESDEDKTAAKPANTTHTPAAADAADTGSEAAIKELPAPPAPPAQDCRRFAAMYERMISPSGQTPGLVC